METEAEKPTPEQLPNELKETQKSSSEEQEVPRDPEIDRRLDASSSAAVDLGVVKLYDRSGDFLFSGSPDQLLTFWDNKDYGRIENIGGITDEEGKSIFRFGAGDDHGFTSRERVPDIFQQLRTKVEAKKSIAQDQQELAGVRASLGEELAVPQPETQQKTEQEIQREFSSQENLFDSDKAQKILEVTKDWTQYGGNFYDHLTGKRLKLEAGVDYQVNANGQPDMASFREARKKLVDAWLQEPGNQKWMKDADAFQRSHQHEISSGTERVGIQQPNGTVIEKERHTKPYLFENGWLYYESNYFDKQTNEMRQKDRESTKYRVYFNVEGGDVMPTFQEVIEQLAADPEMQKHGFQIKTADASKMTESEMSQIMNQKDRIVLYLGEEGMQRALPILEQYAASRQDRFKKEGLLLAQPLLDQQGDVIPGITLTSETKGRSPDPAQFAPDYRSFNDMQSKILESSFRSLATGLNNPQTREQLRVTHPQLEARLSQLPLKAKLEDVMRTILQDPEGEAFFVRNLQSIYPQWAKAFGMSERNIAFKK